MTALNLRAASALSSLLLLAAPAVGQNGQQPVIITPPIGGFDLQPGTPTPRPTPTPAPAPSPTAVRPTPIPATPTAAPTPTASPAPARPSPTPTPAPAPAPRQTPSVAATRAPAPPFTPVATPTPGAPQLESDLTANIAAAPASTAPALPGWLWPLAGGLALLLAGGLAGWGFGRRRRRVDADTDADANDAPVADRAATPPPQPPAPTPGPPPLARNVPQTPPNSPRTAPVSPPILPPPGPLAVELRPLRAGIRDGQVVLDFELFVQNRGADPAENVRAILGLIGASAGQDDQIAAFHAAARLAPGSEPFSLAPGGIYKLGGQVTAPGDQIAAINIQGKQGFVPIVPVALKWYAGLTIRTLRDTFMVGTAPTRSSDRLGPLWVDRAATGFGPLAARRYAPKSSS